MIYVPKDQVDFSFYSAKSTNLSTVAGETKIRTKNQGAGQEGITVDYSMSAADWVDSTKPAGAGIMLANMSTEADCIAFYWKGMKPNDANVIRIDITRKFNGFPLSEYRDVIDLIRPKKTFDPKKTIDVVSELQMAVP